MRRWGSGQHDVPIAADDAPRGPAPLLSTAIAVAIGTLVLLDLLLDMPLFNTVGALLVEYGIIVATFALLLGLLNVLTVHLRKVQRREGGWLYSLLLLGVTLTLVTVGLMERLLLPESGVLDWAVANVLLPLQSAFFSLLAFFLLSVAFRAGRIRSLESLLLVASAAIVIVGATPLGSGFGAEALRLKTWLLAVPATAGGRGLLLGIALGTLVTGLRLIFDGRRYFK